MSNFACEKCGTVCIDGGAGVGYTTGCEHYPADVSPRREFTREMAWRVGEKRKIKVSRGR